MSDHVQILLATYQSAAFLPAQLRSILQQTHGDWHLLIRDDASTDATWAILEDQANRDPGRIRPLRTPANAGALANFATLLDHADAPYVMFADADDWWLPDKISKTLACMKNLEARYGPTTPLLVHTDLKVADRDLGIRFESFWRYQGIRPGTGTRFNRLLIENAVTGCTVMLNRALVEAARPIPRDLGAIIMHDWWLALVAAAFGQIGTVNEATVLYRQHGQNHTGAKAWSTGVALGRLPHFFDNSGLRAAMAASQRQAAAFAQRYGNRLSGRQARMVSDYVALYEQNAVCRRRLILAHGFYRTGLLRNLSLLLRG